MLKRAVIYGLIYAALSLGTKIVLMMVLRLKVPQDNRIIAPVVLIVPPLAAALLGVLTAVLTVVVTRATGKSMGLLEPMLSRPMAGMLAALAVRLQPTSGENRVGGAGR